MNLYYIEKYIEELEELKNEYKEDNEKENKRDRYLYIFNAIKDKLESREIEKKNASKLVQKKKWFDFYFKSVNINNPLYLYNIFSIIKVW